MVRSWLILALVLAVPAACNGNSRGPKGWKPVPGASAAWSSGGASPQTYLVLRSPFSGTLQDLASQVTIDNLLHHQGAKFLGSIPLAACPGAAGLATFRLEDGMTLQQAFAVRDGQAIRVGYLRPTGSRVDADATAAMAAELCSLGP
jgi:hypothetical protein